MPWRQFWKRATNEPDQAAEQQRQDTPSPASASATLPPHMQRIVQERKKPNAKNPDLATRLARLERNRLANMYDIEQGELAATPDNPWRQRIDLLTQAMGTVQDDLATAKRVTPGPYYPLPATPVSNIQIETDPVATVSFSIGDEVFRYAEDLDWSERGHQLAQSELRLRDGIVDRLIPAGIDLALREPLISHLDESLFVFASDLRDRKIDGHDLPMGTTLADMAKPCPVCGGWTDFLGRCQQCRQRDATLHALKREEDRLLSERGREAEEQHRLTERLPNARRRLRDIDAEIENIRSRM